MTTDVGSFLAVHMLGHEDGPNDAPFQQGDEFLRPLTGTFLGPMLHDNSVPVGGLDHQSSLLHVMGAGLFDIDVFARLAGEERSGCMPMITGSDEDRIDRRIIQDAAQV